MGTAGANAIREARLLRHAQRDKRRCSLGGLRFPGIQDTGHSVGINRGVLQQVKLPLAAVAVYVVQLGCCA
jgi:hypothetical protein